INNVFFVDDLCKIYDQFVYDLCSLIMTILYCKK
ncbi:hypothetical protein QMU_0464, partial [Clostridioides difficile DA00310]